MYAEVTPAVAKMVREIYSMHEWGFESTDAAYKRHDYLLSKAPPPRANVRVGPGTVVLSLGRFAVWILRHMRRCWTSYGNRRKGPRRVDFLSSRQAGEVWLQPARGLGVALLFRSDEFSVFHGDRVADREAFRGSRIHNQSDFHVLVKTKCETVLHGHASARKRLSCLDCLPRGGGAGRADGQFLLWSLSLSHERCLRIPLVLAF